MKRTQFSGTFTVPGSYIHFFNEDSSTFYHMLDEKQSDYHRVMTSELYLWYYFKKISFFKEVAKNELKEKNSNVEEKTIIDIVQEIKRCHTLIIGTLGNKYGEENNGRLNCNMEDRGGSIIIASTCEKFFEIIFITIFIELNAIFSYDNKRYFLHTSSSEKKFEIQIGIQTGEIAKIPKEVRYFKPMHDIFVKLIGGSFERKITASEIKYVMSFKRRI